MNRDNQNKQYSEHTLTTLISNDMISHKDQKSNKSKKSTSKDQHFYKQLFSYEPNNKKQMKRFHTAENPLHQQQQLYYKNSSNQLNNDKIYKKPKSSNSFMNNRMFFPHQKVITINNKNKKQQVIISLNYNDRVKRQNKSLDQKKIKNELISQNQGDNEISYNTIDQYNQKQSRQSRQSYKQKSLTRNIKSKSNSKYSAQNLYFEDKINRKINSNSNVSSFKKINVSSSQSQRKPVSRSSKIMPLLSQIKQIQKPIAIQVKNNVNSHITSQFTLKNQSSNMNSSIKRQILPKYLQFYDSFIQSSNLNNSIIHNYHNNSNLPLQTINKTLQMVSQKRQSPSISTIKRTVITPSIIKQSQLFSTKQKQQKQIVNLNSINTNKSKINNNANYENNKLNLLISHKYMPKLKALQDIIINNNKQDNLKFIKAQSYTYYGQVSQQDIPQGLGIIFYKSGKLYQGQLNNGKKSGHGYELFKDGSFYIGQYVNNIKSGRGRFQWPSSTQTYDGQFNNNMKHGSGQWISPQISYFGQWKHNIIQGFGILIEGKQRYQGEFVNFNKHGHGTYRYENGELYTGEFKNNRLNGQGEYFWANGDSYKGRFVNNKRHGYGVLKLTKDNILYKGEFRNDKKCGIGEEYYYLNHNNVQQELYYYGNFENDFKHGWGILKKNHSIIYQGYWVNNQVLQRSNSETPNIIIQQTPQQLNQQISNRIIKNIKKINNTNNKKITNFPKPKDPQLIRGRSRYMRMNNHYIKKVLQIQVKRSYLYLNINPHKKLQIKLGLSRIIGFIEINVT